MAVVGIIRDDVVSAARLQAVVQSVIAHAEEWKIESLARLDVPRAIANVDHLVKACPLMQFLRTLVGGLDQVVTLHAVIGVSRRNAMFDAAKLEFVLADRSPVS